VGRALEGSGQGGGASSAFLVVAHIPVPGLLISCRPVALSMEACTRWGEGAVCRREAGRRRWEDEAAHVWRSECVWPGPKNIPLEQMP